MLLLLLRTAILAVLVLVAAFDTVDAADITNIYGIQSLDVGSSYGASMVYDCVLHQIYVTGSTYGHYFDTGQPLVDQTALNESDCFLGVLQLPNSTSNSNKNNNNNTINNNNNNQPTWIQRAVIGTPGVQDACSAVQVTGTGEQRHVYLFGHSRNFSGVLSPLENGASMQQQQSSNDTHTTKVYGTVLDLSWDGSLNGGYLIDTDMVQYPVCADTIDGNTTDLIVATIHSNNTLQDQPYGSWIRLQGGHEPDTTTAGGYLPPQFGSRFGLYLQRLEPIAKSKQISITTIETTDTIAENPLVATRGDVTALFNSDHDEDNSNSNSNNISDSSDYNHVSTAARMIDATPSSPTPIRNSFLQYAFSFTGRSSPDIATTLQIQWQKNISTSENVSIQVSAVKSLSNNMILVAGSTKGTGSFFSSGNNDEDDNNGNSSATTMSGFITVVDALTSSVINSIAVSSSNSNDRIIGMCTHNNSDIYVVGMTDGNLLHEGTSPPLFVRSGYYQAFIRKLDFNTLQTVWTFQLGGLHPYDLAHVHGLSCAVTPDGGLVYMAGNVKDGAVISVDGVNASGISAGRDDVFVAQLDSIEGEVIYAKQLGTIEDDNIGNGNALISDRDGNAAILINSKGSFLRRKGSVAESGVSDIVILSLDRDTGAHLPVISQDGLTSSTNTITQPNALRLTQTPISFVAATQTNSNAFTSVPNSSSIVATNAPTVDSGLSEESINKHPPTPIPTEPNLIEDQLQPSIEEYTITIENEKSRSKSYMIATIFLVLVIIVGSVFMLISRRRKLKRPSGLNHCLNHYKANGIEANVIKSATGGYKVVYLDDHNISYDFKRVIKRTEKRPRRRREISDVVSEHLTENNSVVQVYRDNLEPLYDHRCESPIDSYDDDDDDEGRCFFRPIIAEQEILDCNEYLITHPLYTSTNSRSIDLLEIDPKLDQTSSSFA